jgi:hypothetical protein
VPWAAIVNQSGQIIDTIIKAAAGMKTTAVVPAPTVDPYAATASKKLGGVPLWAWGLGGAALLVVLLTRGRKR